VETEPSFAPEAEHEHRFTVNDYEVGEGKARKRIDIAIYVIT